jgi:hypothetical protein
MLAPIYSISVDALIHGLNKEAVEMSGSETNYCKEDKMSICTAEDSKQQERCSFFEKSSYEHRCMYFIFDEYCDCLKAQIHTK